MYATTTFECDFIKEKKTLKLKSKIINNPILDSKQNKRKSLKNISI